MNTLIRNIGKSGLILILLLHGGVLALAQSQGYLLKASRVFDGENMHTGWVVLVEGNRIAAVGPEGSMRVPKEAERIELPGHTLLPGLIEGHSHLLLYPYDQMPWNDQVLKESNELRAIRGGVHAEQGLQAGFTTVRDLGTEGAGFADVALKQAIEQGIIPGPRLIVSGRAIVATGSYGPKGFKPDFEVPLGAEAADGDAIIRVVRDQIGKGADFIKVYADYRWGPDGQARPTFLQEELELMVRTAASSGRVVAAHAGTAEGMRRATLAGVKTIEHGDDGTLEVFRLMKEKGVALCPTLAAGDAISRYRGWDGRPETEPQRIKEKKESFRLALESGVTIIAGGDVGVFPHGENARELELMVEYGMAPLAVLRSATAVNAAVFELPELGLLQPGFLADIIAVEGDPLEDIHSLRKVALVMKDGVVVRH
ncbi:MAG: amidohydrolase family protein [Phaeodactylibacter sp.]|nr:amidohydrolase family protein [Phaeodactylibacter sp.]MCB9301739.1 amidohydrolase family protein [Lewinellaceae bacterium]